MNDGGGFACLCHAALQFFSQHFTDLFVGFGVNQVMQFVGVMLQIVKEGFGIFRASGILNRVFIQRFHGIFPAVCPDSTPYLAFADLDKNILAGGGGSFPAYPGHDGAALHIGRNGNTAGIQKGRRQIHKAYLFP